MKIVKKEKKESRLSKKADKAHDKAKSRNEAIVGYRKTPASPRTLTQGKAPVYKKESKIREKISNIEPEKDKKKKKRKSIPSIFKIEKKVNYNPPKRKQSKGAKACKSKIKRSGGRSAAFN